MSATQPFIGEIFLFAGNFAPRNYALCNGQLLAISQNTALFSILGTTYGGNGTTTFALPDLRDRMPLHMGQGPGLSSRVLGQTGGASSVTLTVAQLPAHVHPLTASGTPGNSASPSAARASVSGARSIETEIWKASPSATVNMAPNALGNTGSGQAHENRSPYLGVNYCIALVGIFPSRN
jgi:microcystin-dependent protein